MLEQGIPERMHFSAFFKGTRDIIDSVTGRVVPKNVAEFDVDRLNGQPTNAKFSVLAEKLFAQLEPYTLDNTYKNYEFVVTRIGAGFTTSFSVQVIPLGK